MYEEAKWGGRPKEETDLIRHQKIRNGTKDGPIEHVHIIPGFGQVRRDFFYSPKEM